MDPDGDARRSYLAGLLRGLWAPRNTRLSEDKASQQAVTQFLDDLQCNVLHARLASGSDGICLANTLEDQESGNNDETAAFLKLHKATPLTPDNMSTSVQLTSALQTPLQSLYQTVHQVYAPLLLRDDARASLLSQKLKDVLLELDAGLAGTVLLQGGSDAKKPKTTPSDGDEGLMSIATMSDEFAYWEAMQDDSRQARRAKKFSAVFDTVHQRFSAPLGDLSFDDMADLLDDVSNVADDLWRLDLARDQLYPQRRMDHLLGLVTYAINTFVLAKAKSLTGADKESEGNVWQAPFHAVHHLLQQGVTLCEKWRNSIESLTGTLWPAHSEHPWEGSVSSQTQRVQLLSTRLEQVLRVRTTYEELSALLPSRGSKKQEDELADSCFRPFERLRPLYYNAYTEPAWQRALSEFDRSLAPMETQVAVVLRERLRAVTSKPSAAARLLQRYQHLLQRPTLAQALAGERDALLAQLLAHVDQLDSDFEARKQNLGSSTGAREKSGMHVGKTLSSDVNVIVWAHALGRRVADMQRLARGVLADLPALPRLSQQCDKLAAKASGLVLDRVRDWQESMLRALDDDDDSNGGQSLRLRGRLMQIDKQSGDLVVNFSEFLVTLLRDVRQLTELSSQQATQSEAWVPTRIRQVAEEAEKYYRFGVTLQKVANFYNSIEAQIIDEQKPMLLDSLLAFEDAVQRPGVAQSQNQKTKSKDVTWANLDECDEYVSQLQTAADRLAAENRRFKRAHEKLGEELLALMDVDLLRYPQKWKERWDEIKKNAQLTTRKQDSARTAKWFLYWDHQLYKVLESGYQLGLEMLNENLPEIKEIKTELHFPTASAAMASSSSGGSILVLKPPIEELRTTYYKAMKKFVARPTKFGGFANPHVFSAMCDANARNLVRVYEACERLFTRLEGLLYEYEHWGFLARIGGGGNVDLDAIMESTLQEPVDWEINFKTIRTKRKESEKIPDSVKVDCIHLSFVPFKRSLDEHMQRFTDALLLSLRKSTLNHIRIVEDFVDASMESLNKRPHSIDEISAAQLEWKDIDARRNDVQAQFQKAEKKKTLLLAVLGGGSSAGMSGASLDTSEVETRLSQLPTRWENFEIALEAFNDMIEEQRESLKGEIEAHVVECNVDIDKLREQWRAKRPVEVQSWEDEALVKVYAAMTEWRQRMDELKTRCVTLTSNCGAFSMNEPVFDGLAALDDDITKLQRNWDTYRQFREEIQALAAQDWFAFCTNMFALADTAQKWADAVKEQAAQGSERTPVVDKIVDFNTNVKRAMPTLKLCRGEPFKDDHWTQLFRKLGFPRGVEKNNLIVQHFIDVFPVLELPATLQFVKKQLRFYLDTRKSGKDPPPCLIRMNDAEFAYTYEYQGNAPKLVHTPLTDKCYLTLTQGMHMGFGGNPYGPAGTGKTESVKALGGQFGRQVLVFNCDEGIDFQSMGRIFIGLVKCGAWGCFDEFNRLKEDQLSAISQQIQVIQDAIKEKTGNINLLNRSVDVDFNAGIFVTLNPAGKGYGGRSKLPDNLKALFRPVAMGRPDNNLIAEVILYSEGFSEAKDIASKVVSLYSLSGQLLSRQQHYDWGLRALKAVLNTAGKLLQAEKKDRATSGRTSAEESKSADKPVRMTTAEETEILIKAVRINTLSKLTFVDSTRFLALIGDVFPGVESADLAGGALGDAIRDVMTSKPFFLQVDDLQIRKMLQLKESLDQRMGCVVVGPSGSGKSTVWQVLQQALIRCGQLVKTHVMNPKSMPRERLLGHMDLDTREWEDGVLTAAARQVVKEPENVRSWIICDGDVDPEWIESLNSVLDDNHLLTLPNGERINFGPNVNFVFETHDLRFASPATISRMGMIFLSDEDMAIERLVSKWLLTLPPTDPSTSNTRDALKQWIDELFTRGLEELHKYEAIVATTTVGTIMNGLSHVATATTRSEFVCAMIRGLGANLAMGSRASFAKSLFMMANERPPDVNNPLDCYCQGSTFYTYETKRDTYGAMDGKMDRKDLVVNGTDAVVPTVSVQRGLKLIEPWVDKMEPFILVGPEGSGKNMLIRQAFKNLKSVTVSVLHCNAQTTADHVIHKIAQCCSLFSTPTGRVYRPRDAERLVLYLKDINLPKPDQYDTCMLIAFLQQLITFNGFYDQHLEFLGVEKIQLVASMNAATTVGRHPLSTRFTAIVKVAYMDYPSTEELSVVYSTFLEGVFDSSNTPNLPATWRDSSNRDRLAKSMVEVYDTVKTKFSVDEQRHYLFTPRDLTKWVFALVRYDLEHEDVLDALAHEARRLFRDRLVDNEAKSKFDGILNSVWKQQWRHAAKLQDVYFSSLHCRSSEAGAATVTAASLQRIASDEFSQVVTQGMVLYEREEKDLHMLLFDEILEHLTIVERVLSEPGGSMLLVGNSGVGRRSATTLISYMLNYTMFSPSITRNYDASSFRTDLKSLLVKAGVEGQHYVLYLEDHHFTQDAILELTNSLLSSGEVPGLYTHEEIEPQIAPLKELMLESIGASGQEHIRTVYDFFVSRVRQYVHVVLGMDARNPQFVLRCESNPALYTRCAIVWMGEWNSSSMARLPELLLNGSELVDSLIKTTPLITSLYASCKEFGATPREFICFLGTWRTLFEAKSKQIVQEIRHLKSGLSKLEEASVTVDELSRNAVLKKKDLSAAQVSADEAMKEITNALDRAATNRREVEDLKKQLAKAETATNARKREIEQELSEITPILQTAMEAVGNIKSDNLNEIRSLKMPPEPIHDVLSAVLMLLGIQDTSWNSMKKFLGNRGVKEDILNYDAHRITPEISKAVTKLVKSKTSSFDHETIYRVSVAAAPLATWVKANLKYSMVLNKIEPLETDLAEAKRSLEASQQRLLQCESELKKIDITVDQMKVQFGEKTKEAEILRVNLEQAQSTLNKAQGLLGKLGGEKHRWSEQVKELEHRLTDLPVRMLLASAFTTFLGKCSEDARKRVVKEWERDILESINPTGSASSLHFDYRKLLSTESELLTWKSMGLPSDNLSMENALIVSNSSGERCPFIIDPASASTTWLQAELAKDTTRPLSIVQSQDARFVNLVEQAVRFGKTLVILEVDNVEPYLYSLVRKDLIHQGPRFVVALGDKVIDYNENFRLYLVTRNPSPPLAPDALAIVNVVNFTVTKSGLEGQLLGVTIQHEQPELEQEKSELLRQEEDCKVQLAALEKQLVEALATSEGDILENTMLVESLTKTKATSAEIENALERSAKKSEELDEKRDTYSPFAREGAKIFFLVKQLSAVNHMYRFSLASFLGLFKATLATKMESSSTKDRILRLIPILEHKVLMFVGRALFKEHRPMFGMHLVHGMHPECFEKNEYEFFCGEVVEIERGSGGHSTLPEWTSPERKEAFTQFVEALPRLAQLCKFESHDMWIRWSKSMECEQNFHPKMDKSGSAGGLSAFQKLLVVQALRPDRLQSAIIQFICGIMQLKSLTPPSLDFKVIGTEEATNTTPVLLLTTAGADPSKELEEVATSVVGKGHYFEVAMGGGQQEKALNLLKSTAEHGEWLCLQNLHLVIAWLPVLEKEFSALNASHKFRLWLTTEPHDAFPLVLLEQSLKMTFESPPGMKKNLQRTYAAWNPAFIAKGSPARAQLLFLLAFFHALLQERRTYIPQGWTNFYEFSFGDFRAGSNVMELACLTSGSGGIDWQTLHGLMENAIYGGRIDNPYDLRVLRCNLTEYFSQELLSGQKSLTRGVKLPQSTQHADFLDIIDRFPDVDAPAMFGLPDNIERSMQRSLSGQVIAQLKALSSSEAEATTFDREKWRAQLGPLLETWGKLTTGFQLEGSSLSSSSGKNLQAMAPADAFVALENDYALDLAQQVNSSLQALKKVIYGTGLLTPAIQTVAKALLKGIVPTEWAAQWEGSENVATWLRGLAMRKRALSEWQEAVSTGQLLTKGLDLSELLHPGTFLNALRQQSAREQKCSMDGMKLLSCWERERLSGTKVEWFELTRLLLQGASFEGGTLLEAVSDAQELVAVPSCYVAFVREDAQEMYEKENCIKTPLYYATDRERMLVEISMPISGDRARWVLAGVALFLGE
ncbi:hypothetical protein JG687_00004962 [Phytophthora cactorum]|uniref:Cytoplasmic dynein 2 heavy chain 1 n=1 Tax=Phytophthora cactorum TaxID=29920 RepID=A0A8T1UPJ7_9STRA|nr:hypothetical protein JG687_00004962 [Phytophthora cactorum]